MSVQHSRIAVALYPTYRTAKPNDRISLFDGQFEISQSGVSVLVQGEISLVWLRNPSINFCFKDNRPGITKQLAGFTDGPVSLRIPGFLDTVNATVFELVRTTDSKGARVACSGDVWEPLRKGSQQNLSAVLLHLPNFCDTLGVGIKRPDLGLSWLGRFNLVSDDWKITLDKAENYQSVFLALKTLGGFALTHIVKIERPGGQQFDIQEIESLKEALFYFLSFARGFWIEPTLEVGFDGNGKKVWESWSRPRTDSWRNVGSWFDRQQPNRLTELWRGFLAKLNDPVWGEPLRRAIRWYIAANLKSGDLEGAIVLAQTGHELLSWTRFVSEKGLTSEGFDKLPASDRLRLLLVEARIPLVVPSLLSSLAPRCQTEKLIDGPHAITFLRNKLVHPTPTNLQRLASFNYNELQDAYLLSLWYLELLLLYVLGYQGEYGNRLIYLRATGQVEPVPWITSNH